VGIKVKHTEGCQTRDVELNLCLSWDALWDPQSQMPALGASTNERFAHERSEKLPRLRHSCFGWSSGTAGYLPVNY
jgi:hypothetical protein